MYNTPRERIAGIGCEVAADRYKLVSRATARPVVSSATAMHRYSVISLFLVGCHRPRRVRPVVRQDPSAAKAHARMPQPTSATTRTMASPSAARTSTTSAPIRWRSACSMRRPTMPSRRAQAIPGHVHEAQPERSPARRDRPARRGVLCGAWEFPIGKAAVLPPPDHPDFDAGCCNGTRKNMCAETSAWTTDPAWSALGFRVTGDSY